MVIGAVELKNILISALTGAWTGWLTNYIALVMLFRPHNKVRFLGITVPFTPGLVPAHREEITRKIADIIEEQLFSGKDLVDLVKRYPYKEEIAKIIENKIDSKLSAFVPGVLRDMLKSLVVREVISTAEEYEEAVLGQIGEFIDVKALVTEKLDSLSIAEVERLIVEASGRELKAITLFGALIGFIIGIFGGLLQIFLSKV